MVNYEIAFQFKVNENNVQQKIMKINAKEAPGKQSLLVNLKQSSCRKTALKTKYSIMYCSPLELHNTIHTVRLLLQCYR